MAIQWSIIWQDKEMPTWMEPGNNELRVKGGRHTASLILRFHLSDVSRQATL